MQASRSHYARWTGAVVVLLLAALLGGIAVVAVYVRTQVLDTGAYVETVQPLAADPVVQDAVAARLSDEIVTGSGLSTLVGQTVDSLVAKGAPAKLSDLVGSLVGALRSFLNDKIKSLLATPQFQAIWDDINRIAHTALVTVLTGRQGKFLNSSGTTVTVDLGQLLTGLKTRLAAQGLTFVQRVPDVSIPYTLVQSDKLPQVRKYTRWLDTAATWLPFVAIALFVGGVMIAPYRRRGLLIGATMLAVVTVLLLIAVPTIRHVYLNRLPDTVRSPAAAAAVFDAIIRFLVSALWALFTATMVVIVAALLAGPSRIAVAIRRPVVRLLDAAGRWVASDWPWTRRVAAATRRIRGPLEAGLAILAAVILVLLVRPSFVTVLIATLILAIVVAVVEILARAVAPPASPPASPV